MDSKQLIQLISKCLVPKIPDLMHRPIQDNDFKTFKHELDTNLEKILNELNSEIIKIEMEKELTTSLLILIGEQHGNGNWVTNSSNIKHKLNCLSQEIMLLNKLFLEDLFINGLNRLKVKIRSEFWKCHPASVTCFTFLINNILKVFNNAIKEEFYSLLLPPILLQIDDFEINYRLNGLNLLKMLLESARAEVLSKSGHRDVILDAIKHTLYMKHTEVLRTAISCLGMLLNFPDSILINKFFLYIYLKYNYNLPLVMIKQKMYPTIRLMLAINLFVDRTAYQIYDMKNTFEVLSVILICQHYYCSYEDWAAADDVIDITLNGMYMETSLEMRAIYVEVLPEFLKNIRSKILLWLKRLFAICQSYMDTSVMDNCIDEIAICGIAQCIVIVLEYSKTFAFMYSDIIDIFFTTMLKIVNVNIDNIKKKKSLRYLATALAFLLLHNSHKLKEAEGIFQNYSSLLIYAEYKIQWQNIFDIISLELNKENEYKHNLQDRFSYYVSTLCDKRKNRQ